MRYEYLRYFWAGMVTGLLVVFTTIFVIPGLDQLFGLILPAMVFAYLTLACRALQKDESIMMFGGLVALLILILPAWLMDMTWQAWHIVVVGLLLSGIVFFLVKRAGYEVVTWLTSDDLLGKQKVEV